MTRNILVGLMLFLLSGCSIGYGKHEASFEGPTGFKSIKTYSIGQQYEERATDLALADKISAQAYRIRVKADLDKALAEQNGQTTHPTNVVIGVVVNDDDKKTVVFRHPYLNETIEVAPEDREFIECPEIPRKILIKFSDQKNFYEKSFKKEATVYDGRKIDFSIKVWSKS